MKRFIHFLTLLLSIYTASLAQGITPAQGVIRVAALPATCTAVGSDGSSAPVRYQGRVYICTATNTWTALVSSTGAVTSILGTASQITASASTGAVTLSLPSTVAISNLTVGGTTPQSKTDIVSASVANSNGGTSSGNHLRLATGTGGATDESLLFGVHDGDYSWVQAAKQGTAYRNFLINPNGGSVCVRCATTSALFAVSTVFSVDATTTTITNGLKFTNLAVSATAPTVTSAGTSPSITANGTAAFAVNVGTGGTATTIVLGMPTAAAGWNCHAMNITATAANRADQAVRQTASTTTSVTLQNQTVSTGAALAFTASDIVRCQCTAY